MAQQRTGFRQPWYPPVSKTPTPEEFARHLRLIYQALNDHDSAIVSLHGQVGTPGAQTTQKAVGSTTQVTPQQTASKKFKQP